MYCLSRTEATINRGDSQSGSVGILSQGAAKDKETQICNPSLVTPLLDSNNQGVKPHKGENMKRLLYGVCCLLTLVVFAASLLHKAKAVNSAPPGGGNMPFALTDEVSVKQMALQSELILTGRCASGKTAWVGRTLVTLATISVGETIKGQATGTLTVVLPGGIDANRPVPISMNYTGAPRILPQEEVFLFLVRRPEVPLGYVVTGYSQGKFSIVEDEKGQKHVSRDLTKVRLRSGAGIGRGNVLKTSLVEFKERIRGYLRQQ
jgi:hypothetical protein